MRKIITLFLVCIMMVTSIILVFPVPNIKAIEEIQSEYDTNDSLAPVFIFIHFSAGQPYDFAYNGWVFIDGIFRGHTIIFGIWCGMVTMGNHTAAVTRKGYYNSATITVEYAFQHIFVQFF
jgi:hypothetical protein